MPVQYRRIPVRDLEVLAVSAYNNPVRPKEYYREAQRRSRAKKRRQSADAMRKLLMDAYDGLVPHMETPDTLARPAIVAAVDKISQAINLSWTA
jgi:hypothetical protein